MKRPVIIGLLIAMGVIIAITWFFKRTVTQSKPTAMKLFLPKEDTVAVDSTSSSVINLLLFNDNEIYAYRGTEYSKGAIFKTTDKSFRDYLIQVKKEVNDSSFAVIIKPLTSATYKNTVNVLDEMTINDIRRYSMVDANEHDQKIIESLRKG